MRHSACRLQQQGYKAVPSKKASKSKKKLPKSKGKKKLSKDQPPAPETVSPPELADALLEMGFLEKEQPAAAMDVDAEPVAEPNPPEGSSVVTESQESEEQELSVSTGESLASRIMENTGFWDHTVTRARLDHALALSEANPKPKQRPEQVDVEEEVMVDDGEDVRDVADSVDELGNDTDSAQSHNEDDVNPDDLLRISEEEEL